MVRGEIYFMESDPCSGSEQRGRRRCITRCAARAHQITTVDRSKLVGEKVGVLSEAKQQTLDVAIHNYLSL